MNPPNATSPLSRYLACLLALILAVQPAVAYGEWTLGKKGLPQHVPDFEGQAADGINAFARPSAAANDEEWTEYLNDSLANRRLSNVEKIQQSGDDIVELMLRYKDLFGESLERIDGIMERRGYDAVMDKMKKDKFKITDPELGTMEFTEVDGEPVGKIIHPKSGVAFIIYNEDRSDKSDKAFQNYIAKQHYDAGSTRKTWRYWNAKGKKKKFKLGRDVLLLGVNGKVLGEDGVELKPRERGFKHWWQATYKTPSKHDMLWGPIGATVQSGVITAAGFGISYILDKAFGVNMASESTPLLIGGITFAYASLLGVWNEFYQNFKNRGTKFARDIKNGVLIKGSFYLFVSLAASGVTQDLSLFDFSFDMNAYVAQIQNAFASLSHLEIQSIVNKVTGSIEYVKAMSWLAIALALHPVHSFFVSNEFKNWTFYKQKIPEREHRDHGTQDFKIPIGIERDDKTGKLKAKNWVIQSSLNKRYWNRQFKYYIPVSSLKTIDQTWFMATIGPAITGDLPAWMPLLSYGAYWTTLILSMRRMMVWANKNHEKTAAELKMNRDMKYYFPFKNYIHPHLSRAWRKTKNLLGIKAEKTECEKLLEQDEKSDDQDRDAS